MRTHQETRPCTDCGEDFTAGPYARWCLNCRWKYRGRPKSVDREWTPEQDEYLRQNYDVRVKRRSTEIAAHLGLPRWLVTRRALQLGLSRAKEPYWSEVQESFLRAHVNRRTTHWMWANMPAPRRTQTAIVMKLKRMNLSRAITDGGYTMRQLEILFGITRRAIDRWAQSGKLRVEMRGYRTNRDTWCVDPADVRAFIRDHRDAYDLRRVDQTAFLALMLDDAAPRIRRAA